MPCWDRLGLISRLQGRQDCGGVGNHRISRHTGHTLKKNPEVSLEQQLRRD